MTPSVEPVYDSRANAMIIMIVIICFLIALLILFLCLFLNRKSNTKEKQNSTDIKEVSEEEQSILIKYRNLKDNDKNVINQMLNSLNTNNLDKE